MENKEVVADEIKRVLKPGGKACIVDWADSFGGIGPKSEHVYTKEQTQHLFESKGFHVDRELSAGSHHYGFIFKKL
jgi:hypothetical protein